MTITSQATRVARIPVFVPRWTRVGAPATDPYLSAECEVYVDADYILSGTADLWRSARRGTRR